MSADPMKIFPKRSNDEATSNEPNGPLEFKDGKWVDSIPCPTPQELVIRDMGIRRPWKDELIEAHNELVRYVREKLAL